MNTLSTNFIQKILSSYKEFSSSLEVLLKNSTVFPVNITGMQGSLTSFFLAEFINRSYLKFRNFQNLKESGLVKKEKDGIKILGSGELTKKLTVKANKFSSTAKEKIENAGGKIEVI